MFTLAKMVIISSKPNLILHGILRFLGIQCSNNISTTMERQSTGFQRYER